jgi:phenylpyruvate tautomerase PptA (4-oxalocrotonate tautomerase family)
MSVCGHCKKTATFLCAECKDQSYCSEECQKEDWAIHQTVCIGPRVAENVFSILVDDLKTKIQKKNEWINLLDKGLLGTPIVEVEGTQNDDFFEIRFKKGRFRTLGDRVPPGSNLPAQTWSDNISLLDLGDLVEDSTEQDLQHWIQASNVLKIVTSNILENLDQINKFALYGVALSMEEPLLFGVRLVRGQFANFKVRLAEPIEIAGAYQRFAQTAKNHIDVIANSVSPKTWTWSGVDWRDIEDEERSERMLKAARALADRQQQKRLKNK